jgi:hypothetical protein
MSTYLSSFNGSLDRHGLQLNRPLSHGCLRALNNDDSLDSFAGILWVDTASLSLVTLWCCFLDLFFTVSLIFGSQSQYLSGYLFPTHSDDHVISALYVKQGGSPVDLAATTTGLFGDIRGVPPSEALQVLDSEA